MKSRFTSFVFAAALCAACSLPLTAADLTLAQVKASSENWPNQIKLTEALDFGASGKFAAGTLVDFYGFENANVRFQHKGQLFLVEPELTDLVTRASRIADGQAAKEGWRGRTADYLTRKGQVVTASGFAPVGADAFRDDTLLVVYYGNSGCSFCAAAMPFMKQTLDLLEQRQPGRVRRVYIPSEGDTPAARAYARSLGAGWIVAPYGDQFMWGGLSELVPSAKNSVSFPALALVSPKGKFLAAGMREQSKTDSAAAVLKKLDEVLSAPSKSAALGVR
ncbi:hypothetical protein CMV30_17785 [Nibricoccus aquaticus]|uniref:Thioredoxin domain-containing protein n=1 Tax=Nibricoccus aquaticus TaxID=2576891 RepID=A0A290QH91_9BACT|nr:hypothetical protein [Nibricoccus aquaticus]ATC65646.1 hypothetical protein CMV30_17785 [Nibricoccus aquaticus]